MDGDSSALKEGLGLETRGLERGECLPNSSGGESATSQEGGKTLIQGGVSEVTLRASSLEPQASPKSSILSSTLELR